MLLEGAGSRLAWVYANIAADIIRRGERRRGSTTKRAVENAADFFTLFFGTNAWSLYLLMGGSPGSLPRLQLAIVAMFTYVGLHAVNRRLIRHYVLDDNGGARSDLRPEPWVRYAVSGCFLGTLVLLALGSIKYAFS